MLIPIEGCAYFETRKERRQLFYDIKKEYGENVKIKIKRNFITYKGEINNNQMYI